MYSTFSLYSLTVRKALSKKRAYTLKPGGRYSLYLLDYQFPPIGTLLMSGNIRFRQQHDGHTPLPNWPHFIKFASANSLCGTTIALHFQTVQ